MKAPLGHQQILPMLSDIAENFAGIFIKHRCANRHRKHQIIAPAARAIATLAGLAIVRPEPAGVTVINHRIECIISSKVDATAVAAVSTVGAALGNIFFATKTDTAVAAVTGVHFNACFVYKLHGLPPYRVSTAWIPSAFQGTSQKQKSPVE